MDQFFSVSVQKRIEDRGLMKEGKTSSGATNHMAKMVLGIKWFPESYKGRRPLALLPWCQAELRAGLRPQSPCVTLPRPEKRMNNVAEAQCFL